MKVSGFFISGAFCFFLPVLLFSQEISLEEILPELRGKAVVLNITTRIAENRQELWNENISKVTIPGRPVNIKLVGGNVALSIQLTPYLREKGRNTLVAQGQIWIETPNEGIRYKTTMQTIALDFGENIYFFPLGSDAASGNPQIEIQITLLRYEDVLKQMEADAAAAAANPAAGTVPVTPPVPAPPAPAGPAETGKPK
jgi:hypothetical protein